MRVADQSPTRGRIALILALAVGSCGKLEQNEPQASVKARAETKRHQRACASSAAYDRLKGLVFDRAIAERGGDRANLDTLADYSFARMDNPVVAGWDPALDITRCKGRLILEVPPGAERAFAGARRLQADVDYTAQAAADGNGFVYRLQGAEPIIARLAAFNLVSGAYRPPPAIDEQQATQVPELDAVARADSPAARPDDTPDEPTAISSSIAEAPAPRRQVPRALAASATTPPGMTDDSPGDEAGDATVRAFYAALGAGDGEAASARIVPEKQSSRAFSPQAISRFYGGLPEPIRLTAIVPLSQQTYRVRYRYSAGRSRCNGSAVVRLTDRGGRNYIRSIEALGGC